MTRACPIARPRASVRARRAASPRRISSSNSAAVAPPRCRRARHGQKTCRWRSWRSSSEPRTLGGGAVRGAFGQLHASLRRHYPHRYQGCDLTASPQHCEGTPSVTEDLTPIRRREQLCDVLWRWSSSRRGRPAHRSPEVDLQRSLLDLLRNVHQYIALRPEIQRAPLQQVVDLFHAVAIVRRSGRA